MCSLAVVLLSVVSHLAAGQGWMGQGMQGVGTPQNAGWGVGSWGIGTGASTGAIGTGVGIGGTGTGVWPGITRPVNPYFNTTINCAASGTTFTGSATFKRMPQQWGWGGRSNQLTGTLDIRSISISGTFSVVITERSRTEATCTTDGLGPIVGSRPSNPWGGRWGHHSQWNSWGSQSQSNGVLTTITVTPGVQTTVDLSSANFPYRGLESYAGRGLALCTSVSESMGQHVCTSPTACCTLGFDNKDAVTP